MLFTKNAMALASKNKLNAERFYSSSDDAADTSHTTMSFAPQTDHLQSMAAVNVPLASTLAPITPAQPDLLASSDSNISTDNITKNSNLQLAGKVEANSKIHLYVDGKDITAGGALKILADANGNWSFVDSNNAVFNASRVYDVRTVTELGGSLSNASPSLLLNVDRQISAVSTPDLLDQDDSGSSSQDNLTNAATPTLQGTSEARAFVNIYEYNPSNASYTSLFSTRADANGKWLAKMEGKAALGEGTHQLLSRSSDLAGNVSAFSSKFSVTIDRTAPFATTPQLEVSMQLPNDSHSTTYNQPLFIGKAEAGAKVELFDEDRGVAIGGAVAQADTVWQVKSDVLSLGLHHLTVHVTDAAGNMTKSALTDINVVNLAPTAPSMPVLLGKYDSGLVGDHVTNFNQPLFNLSAAAGTTVHLYDAAKGDVEIGKGIVGSNGQVLIATQGAPLQDGNHIIYARAEDASHQLSAKSDSYQLTIDTIAPQISISAPAISNSHTVQLSGTAEPNLDLKVFAGGMHSFMGTAHADLNGKWALALNNVPDGTLSSIVAEGYDVAGNFGKSNAINVVVDTIAPKVTLSLPPVTNSHTVTATGTAEANLPVNVYWGTHAFLGSTVANANGAWSFTMNNVGDGNYYNVQAEQRDAAGNIGVSNTGGIIVDTVAPTVTLNLPVLTNSHSVTAYGVAEANLPVKVYSDGHNLLGSTYATSSGTWSFTLSNVADGVYTNVRAEQSDAAGNLGISNAGSVKVDTVAPSVSLSLPALTNSHSVTASGTAEANLQVNVYSDGHNLLGSTTANASGQWSFTLNNVGDGTYNNVRAEQTDAAGNVGVSNPGSVTVDTIAPILSFTNPSYFNSHNVMLSGTAEPGQVHLYVNYGASNVIDLGVANVNGGNWYLPVNGAPDGGYSLTVIESDAAGNVGRADMYATVRADWPLAPQAAGNVSLVGQAALEVVHGAVM